MYFITCMQYNGTELKDGIPYYGAMRTFGFEETYEDAEYDLNMNNCDMHEYLYSYAVIECIHEGRLTAENFKEENQTWFQYDRERDGFFRIEKPNNNEPIRYFAFI